MEINLDVYMTDYETNIQFYDNKSTIKISDASKLDVNSSDSILYFLLKENNIKYIGQTIDKNLKKDQNFDKVIKIIIPSEVNLEYLEYAFIKEAIENEIKLVDKKTSIESMISNDEKSDTDEYKAIVLFILKNFGYDLFKLKNNIKLENKPVLAKARHKWSREISQIEFMAKSKGGEGKVIWKSKDELVLLSGAKLVLDPQMNKDGTINYSAQFAQKLRLDHLDKIVDNFTTVDIIFASPNQLGMFLFFGGQNTWVELKDVNGKTLDEWTRVD